MAFGTMRVALRALLLALPFVAVIAALTSVGTVGRVLGVAQGVRKGFDVFVSRLSKSRRSR